MRVTQKMMTDRMSASLSAAADRLMRLQTEMSTARRLSRPSDDPVGITRDLSFRTTISAVEQYRSNASWAKTELNTMEQSLGSVTNLLTTARELATALADDTFDATARHGAAQEAKTILDQILQAGNTQNNGRYLFSGHLTRNQTFLATPTGVVYQGDQGLIYTQIEASSQMATNMLGSDIMLAPLQTLGEKFDLNRGVAAAVPLADLHQGQGIDQAPGIVRFADDALGLSVTVDLSAATTVGDVLTAINTQLAAGGMTGVTASVSPGGNALRLTAADNGLISTSTQLTDLNRSRGIDQMPGKLRVATDSLSIDVTVDLAGTQTVGDVITAFNTQLAAAGVANVTMSVNPAGTGIQITDANAAPLGLQVLDSSGESTAQDLGVRGYVNAQIIGNDLNPTRRLTVTENAPGETTAAGLGILGSFTATKDGLDLDPILRDTTPLSQLDSGRGIALGRIRISQGSAYAVVDLASAATVADVIARINSSGLEIQVSLNAAGTGIQVVSTVTGKTLIIKDEGSNGGSAALGIKGSPDLLGNLMLLVDSLENNDRAMVGNLIGGLQKATDHILDSRASVGARIRRIDSTSDRLSALSVSVTGLLSEIEDADIVKVTTELATQQNIYQAALNATARILQPSLIDFVQ
jgi:flagellar hook-associated protein 3 FlgL